MAKIPSRKFSTAKKKIPSRKFPKGTAKIPSRKFAVGTKAASKKPKGEAQAPLDRPSNEKARKDRIATLTGRIESLKTAGEL